VHHAPLAYDLQAVHLPEIDLPAVVAPKNVAVAVGVEVAAALNVPIVGDQSVRNAAFGGGLKTRHAPDVELAAVVAPKKIAGAVAVEIGMYKSQP
jgi:hypothetical protein